MIQQTHFCIYNLKDLKAESQKDICTPCSVPGSKTHNSPEEGATQVFKDRWMDFLKCGIYIQWIIIQLYKGNSVICYNRDEPWQHYAKRNKQSQRDKYIMYGSSYMRYVKQSNSQKQKAEWWLPRNGGTG